MASTALLVMDVQQGIVGRFGDDEGYLPRLAGAWPTDAWTPTPRCTGS